MRPKEKEGSRYPILDHNQSCQTLIYVDNLPHKSFGKQETHSLVYFSYTILFPLETFTNCHFPHLRKKKFSNNFFSYAGEFKQGAVPFSLMTVINVSHALPASLVLATWFAIGVIFQLYSLRDIFLYTVNPSSNVPPCFSITRRNLR